jgi:hypothetical protein
MKETVPCPAAAIRARIAAATSGIAYERRKTNKCSR